jgi:ABC-type uncharacterized transport system involved in gliding motility auxiliary subunit
MLDGIKSSVISKGLSGILMYLCSEINTGSLRKDLKVVPLLQTSASSGIMDGPDFDISPERFLGEKLASTLTLPPLTVAADFKGSFTSYFAGRPEIEGTTGFVSKTDKGEIIVVSDSDIIRDFIVSASSANMMFVLNTIDYLLNDTSLNEVRSRNIPNSPLSITDWLYKRNIAPEKAASVEPKLRQAVKLVNLILPSLLLVLFGLRRLFQLKKSRRLIRQRYQPPSPEPEENASKTGEEQG